MDEERRKQKKRGREKKGEEKGKERKKEKVKEKYREGQFRHFTISIQYVKSFCQTFSKTALPPLEKPLH